jgi:ADP-L-glycero-D-manno-heptose 6-epimerase
MYIVTGGAGFIGSNVVAELALGGKEVVVCDWLGRDDRWQNLAKHELAAIVAPDALSDWLARNGKRVDALIHMGAISSTTEADVDLIVSRNITATLDLIDWCTQHRVRVLYASSAATYGDGRAGFSDDWDTDSLSKLRPLSAYGWSKHVVDRRISRLHSEQRPLPPQWVGLKFFNVYGPNEYHKGSMKSVLAQNFSPVRDGASLKLFRSHRSDIKDGEQRRDFVYVNDCVRVLVWLLDSPHVSGIFNVGTGAARTWLELGRALFATVGQEPRIEFIEMPENIRDGYQYRTEARMDRLREAGFSAPFTRLEEGVQDYVQRYLMQADPYR